MKLDPMMRLLDVYRAEVDAYRQVLHLAREGVECVRQGRPLSDLQLINLEKKRWLDDIRALESSVDAEKIEWQRRHRLGPRHADLDALLGQIMGLIEEIMDQERETDQWIVRAAGLEQSQLATA